MKQHLINIATIAALALIIGCIIVLVAKLFGFVE